MSTPIKHTPYNIMKSAVDMKISPTIEEIRKINSFFLIRYISNDPASIYIANALNCNYRIPIEAQYKFVQHSTLDKVAFINYPKKEKIVSNKDLKILSNHFKTKESVTKEYLKILGTKRIIEILDKYNHLRN